MALSAKSIAGFLLFTVASPGLALAQDGGCGVNYPRYTAGCISDAANYLRNDRSLSGDVSDYIERVRLDAKDPDAHHGRGTRDQAKSDLIQLIAYYNAAIKLDPKDDDAYFHRALANFYAGALPKALADLSQAIKLDPEYAYYALWIDIVDKRGNLPGHFTQAISKVDMTKWPAPVIRLFLGETTPAAVLAAADDPDPKTKTGQLCEANFYIGQLALRQGAKDEAERLFRLSAAGCPHEFVEGSSATAELQALDGSR